MSDPQNAPPTSEAPQTTDQAPADQTGASLSAAPEAPKQEAAPERSEPDLSLLDQIDAEVLRKHPRVAGILGDMHQKARTRWETEQREQTETAAQKKAQEELERLAKEDPYAFSQKYLSEQEQARIKSQLDGVKGSARQELVQRIGRHAAEKYAFGQDETQRIAAALVGVPDEDVVAVFNATVTDIEADRRAERLYQDRWDKDIAKEREAIRKEVAEELRRGDPVADMRRGTPVPPANLAGLSGVEFDRAFEATYPTARRTVPAT